MARCAFHVQEGSPLEIQPTRHYCEEHYFLWRDGARTGPAHVDNSDCRRACEACRAELAAASGNGNGAQPSAKGVKT